jgi:hypothetical protein
VCEHGSTVESHVQPTRRPASRLQAPDGNTALTLPPISGLLQVIQLWEHAAAVEGLESKKYSLKVLCILVALFDRRVRGSSWNNVIGTPALKHLF